MTGRGVIEETDVKVGDGWDRQIKIYPLNEKTEKDLKEKNKCPEEVDVDRK